MSPEETRLLAAIAAGFVLIPVAGGRGDFAEIALVRSRESAIDVAQFPRSGISRATRFGIPLGPPSIHRWWPILRSEFSADPVVVLDAVLNWPRPDDDHTLGSWPR
jgi:hypothetical protein